MYSHRQIFTYLILFNLYTSKYRNLTFCIWLEMYWRFIISEILRGSCVIWSPPIVFFIVFRSFLQSRLQQTCTFLLSLIWAGKFFRSCVFIPAVIHLLLLEVLPSVSVIDWFLQSGSDFDVHEITLGGKKESCLRSSSFQLILTSLCT